MTLAQVFNQVFPDYKIIDISIPRKEEVAILYDRYGIDCKLYLKRNEQGDLLVKCIICDSCPSYMKASDITKLDYLIDEYNLIP